MKEWCPTCGEELLRCKGCGEVIVKNCGWSILFDVDPPGHYHPGCNPKFASAGRSSGEAVSPDGERGS